MSHGLLTRTSSLSPPPWQDSALYVALAMAVFAMLFGTRQASAAEHTRGLVLAMAFESLLKLGAMLALGAFVAFGLDGVTSVSSPPVGNRSEEHTSELQSLMRISYAVFCLHKKQKTTK